MDIESQRHLSRKLDVLESLTSIKHCTVELRCCNQKENLIFFSTFLKKGTMHHGCMDVLDQKPLHLLSLIS